MCVITDSNVIPFTPYVNDEMYRDLLTDENGACILITWTSIHVNGATGIEKDDMKLITVSEKLMNQPLPYLLSEPVKYRRVKYTNGDYGYVGYRESDKLRFNQNMKFLINGEPRFVLLEKLIREHTIHQWSHIRIDKAWISISGKSKKPLLSNSSNSISSSSSCSIQYISIESNKSNMDDNSKYKYISYGINVRMTEGCHYCLNVKRNHNSNMIWFTCAMDMTTKRYKIFQRCFKKNHSLEKNGKPNDCDTFSPIGFDIPESAYSLFESSSIHNANKHSNHSKYHKNIIYKNPDEDNDIDMIIDGIDNDDDKDDTDNKDTDNDMDKHNTDGDKNKHDKDKHDKDKDKQDKDKDKQDNEIFDKLMEFDECYDDTNYALTIK